MVLPQESARQSLCEQAHGGKSGLHRARCQVTPGGREPTESATERYRLSAAQAAPVRVKWCGKSAPRGWQHSWHGKPHLEQGQIGKHAAHVGRTMAEPGLTAASFLPRAAGIDGVEATPIDSCSLREQGDLKNPLRVARVS